MDALEDGGNLQLSRKDLPGHLDWGNDTGQSSPGRVYIPRVNPNS